MPGHDVIVIGASAGGVEALKQLVANLPADLPAAVCVVLHVSSHGTSVLPAILRRAGRLPAEHVDAPQLLEPGRIYVAPPNKHLLIKSGFVSATHGATENGHRPAVDPLFRTAARTYGPGVIGVVLSGVLDDATAGLAAIKLRGGIAVVQHPEDAMYSGMPLSAIENVQVDHVVPVAEMAALLVRLAREAAPEDDRSVPENMQVESEIAELDEDAMTREERPGKPSEFACPDCGGALWELSDGALFRFRCRVGHAYSAQTLLAEKMDSLEDAFWVALRALEESAALARRLAERSKNHGSLRSAERFAEQAAEAEQRAAIVREVLLNGRLNTLVGSEVEPDANV